MDGAGLAAVLALGACGAQMGTAFLPVTESGAPESTNARCSSTPTPPPRSRAPSQVGPRAASAMRSSARAESENIPLLPFPVQNKATGPLRAAAAKQNNPDYVSLWAGQAYTLVATHERG